MGKTNFVALLAEGVDRNCYFCVAETTFFLVALLAEGVDRNVVSSLSFAFCRWSPSSRRAWIEISSWL